MIPHYYSELFKQSAGCSSHDYILPKMIERAEQELRDPKRSIIEAELHAGFQTRAISPACFENFRAPIAPRLSVTGNCPETGFEEMTGHVLEPDFWTTSA